MATLTEIQEKFYSAEGWDALNTKLKTSVKFFNEQEVYPFSHKMLGYAEWSVESQDELYGRIKELQQLTGIPIKEKIHTAMVDGNEIKSMELIIKWRL